MKLVSDKAICELPKPILLKILKLSNETTITEQDFKIKLDDLISYPDKHISYIKQDTDLIAMVKHELNHSNEAPSLYISELYVSSGYRGMGLAKSLLLDCQKVAFKHKCDSCYLVVHSENTPARKLYEKQGYKYYQARTSYIGRIDRVSKPEVWMLKHSKATAYGTQRFYSTPYGDVSLWDTDVLCYVHTDYEFTDQDTVTDFICNCCAHTKLLLILNAYQVPDGNSYFQKLGWKVGDLMMVLPLK